MITAIACVAMSLAAPNPAMGVLQRTLGPAAAHFHLNQVPGQDDRFTISASNGEVTISGTSPTAICRGAYEYLKDACHAQVSWAGNNIKLPATLPDYAKRTVVCPVKYRHYFNVCTFGYTTVWWDWKRWQREIDWMALHGINMPLAMNGQEKVFQTVFRSYGLSDADIRMHFGGPAFLPWHRMGNQNDHMGLLPQSWIDGQATLQKQILKRERELGMTPVVPGFSGFVPKEFAKVHPEVKLMSPAAWAGFAPTTFVDVRNPVFVEIGKKFIQEYRKEFGSDHLYLCDTFNEQNPQFPKETELQDLAACGKAVYDSIKEADPDGVWVTQGWLFYNAMNYWTQPRANALLGSVPEGKLIVLDLANAQYEVWRHQPAVRDAGWIFNTLHNYGQNTSLEGPLQTYADVASNALADANHGKMLGMGLTMEGIDQNPVVYELMTDMMWRTKPVDVKKWINGYADSRYGNSDGQNRRDAWQILLNTVYADQGHHGSWRQRPSDSVDLAPWPATTMAQAVSLMASQTSHRNPLYERDLVDITKTWLSALADQRLMAAQIAPTLELPLNKQKENLDRFFEILHDLDRVMACRPEHRLSSWIADARKWGKTPAEKDVMEQNARMQVTVWGGPYLYDYANKEWAGLNEDFIRRRWELHFAGKDSDLPKWELDWAMSVAPIKESKPTDIVKLATDLLRKYTHEPTDMGVMLGVEEDKGIAVGKPVRDSGGTEGSHSPSLVTDGSVFGDYWSASPAPQWVEIDLQTPQLVTGVQLFPYRGDQRSYQYRIETSNDDQNWTTMAEGEGPATIKGYAHRWEAKEMRYIRVTMLHNSANPGVHLYEVRVFGNK